MKTLADLAAIKDRMQSTVRIDRQPEDGIRVVVGLATCGIAAGAVPVLETIKKEIANKGLKNVNAFQTGCIGVCKHEPIVEVYAPGQNKVTYVSMTPEKAKRVVAEHLANGNVVEEYTISAE
ncbi:MAG: (2Fe-2S) ferredoxin domain-containing protein [Bacillota bacterium]|jgi:NADP-reducing hydrogenase subunit HndB